MSHLAAANRPAWYDRSPVMVGASYNAPAIAPHGDTIRWTYTVPTATKAAVEAIHCHAIRDVLTASPSTISASIQAITGVTNSPYIAHVVVFSGALDAGRLENIGSTIMLIAGAVIRANTIDVSTGGSVHYNLSAKITEYNA